MKLREGIGEKEMFRFFWIFEVYFDKNMKKIIYEKVFLFIGRVFNVISG